MRKCSLLLLLCLLAVGCTSRADRGATVNDIWVIGEALHNHTERISPADAKLMGMTLKKIADRQAKELDVELDKECPPCRSTPMLP